MLNDTLARAKALLLQPKATWPAIALETTPLQRLYTHYLLPLAAIPAVCGFIGMSLVGMGGFGFSVRVPLLAGLSNALLSFVLTLVGVWVLGLIVDALAPTFGGTRDKLAAQRVAVYASTAALAGGVFMLLPMLSVLGLLAALYSVYLLYLGLPVLMRCPADKAVPYTAVVVVAAIVLGVVIGALSAVAMPGRYGSAAITLGTPGGNVTIDNASVEAAAQRMEQAAKAMEHSAQQPGNPAAATQAAQAMAQAAGAGATVAAESLKAALPTEVAGMPRTALQVQDGRSLGLPMAMASADYASGDRSLAIKLNDVGGINQLAIAAALMVQGEREDAQGSEKTWQADGRSYTRKLRKDGSRAEMQAVLKNGLMVEVEGRGISAAEVEAAVQSLDLARLEALPRQPSTKP